MAYGRWCFCCPGVSYCCRFLISFWLIVTTLIALGVWVSFRLALMIFVPYFIWMFLLCNFGHSLKGLRTIQLITLLMSLLFLAYCLVYSSFASQTASGYWALQMGTPICDQSSCSSVTNQDAVPYRPSSYGPLTRINATNQVESVYFHYCPNIHCRWAGSNGNNTIQGYEEDRKTPCSGIDCPHLATTNVRDYPNRGLGLAQGWFPASVTTETELCEGVDPSVPLGQLPRGRLVCSICTHTFYDWGLIPTKDGCSDSGGDWFCWACPGAIAGEKTDFATLEQVSIFFLFTSIWFFYLFILLVTSWRTVYVEIKGVGPGQPSTRSRIDYPIVF